MVLAKSRLTCSAGAESRQRMKVAMYNRTWWDLPQHWRWRGASRPPLAVNTPPRPSSADPLPPPSVPAPHPRPPHPVALHVHAMHSLFMAATTLCFSGSFLAPVTSTT
ncbi:unnamed protein product, partial [Brenthis ino]